jgi:hypothetical protein
VPRFKLEVLENQECLFLKTLNDIQAGQHAVAGLTLQYYPYLIMAWTTGVRLDRLHLQCMIFICGANWLNA